MLRTSQTLTFLGIQHFIVHMCQVSYKIVHSMKEDLNILGNEYTYVRRHTICDAYPYHSFGQQDGNLLHHCLRSLPSVFPWRVSPSRGLK